MNDLATLPQTDGFDVYDETPTAKGASFIKFDGTTGSLWFQREGPALEKKGPYFAVDLQRELLKWGDRTVVERIAQTSEDTFPDVDDLNESTPQSEWRENFNGDLEGPWKLHHSVFLVDPADGAKLIVSNSTTGQRIAFQRLKEAVQFMRSLRGERVIPLIELSSKSMKTKFGTKLRPDFKVLEWRNLGGGNAPVTPPGGPVPKLTTSEIVGDDLPF